MNACSWPVATVTLVDGTQVLDNSEAWRFECEARWILDRPNKPLRQGILENIGQKRGQQAKADLEAKIMELWHARQKVAAESSASA